MRLHCWACLVRERHSVGHPDESGEEHPLEEQRIGFMYFNLFKRWLAQTWDSMFPRGLRRSPLLPLLVIVALIGLPGLGYYLHRRGQISKLKREIKGEDQQPTDTLPKPGGVDPAILTRTRTPGAAAPEFLSTTLLPGLGMSLLQITAYIPGRGEVSLLAAPSLEEMANGRTSPKVGQNDTRGAFEVPWGGMLGGLLSPVGTMRMDWRGHALEAPPEVLSHGAAVGGLLSGLDADSAQPTGMSQSTQAMAVFSNTDFDGHWLSKTDVNVQVQMQAHAMLLTVTAKNVGGIPEPMGIGWHPRFLILSGQRDSAQVRIPGGELLEVVDTTKGLPSGRLLAPNAKMERFQARADAIGAEGIDESVMNPKATGDGAAEEFRDPGVGMGIRMTALTPSIKAMRVTSPSGSSYVSLGAQTNYDDPLGKEWGEGDTPAITVLQPGQTIEWKVRLDIFPLNTGVSRVGGGGGTSVR